jgi:hypothetical protein
VLEGGGGSLLVKRVSDTSGCISTVVEDKTSQYQKMKNSAVSNT